MDISNIPAWVAIFIALLALLHSFYEARQTRKHNRLSVKPRMHFIIPAFKKGRDYGIHLTNQGLGPAIVEFFFVEFKGVKYPGTRDGLLSYIANYQGEKREQLNIHFVPALTTVRAGDRAAILTMNTDDVSEEEQRIFYKFLIESNFTIAFQSMYGDRQVSFSNRDGLTLTDRVFIDQP